jgi:hypothetical protein
MAQRGAVVACALASSFDSEGVIAAALDNLDSGVQRQRQR